MFVNVGSYYFKSAFRAYGKADNFSFEALGLLFDFLESVEADSGNAIELDVIAICCDYCESTIEEINQDYNQEFEDLDEAEDWLQGQTTVVGKTDDTIVFAQF